MTDAAAWAVLAPLLEDSAQKLEQIEMRVPPGATGYVMKARLDWLPKRVYLKFELIVLEGRNAVCGRSFHLEDPR